MLVACTFTSSSSKTNVQEFLKMYNELDQSLSTVSAAAIWKASTDVSDRHTGERIGADQAAAAFRGSRYVIESSKNLLAARQSLSDLEFRQLDKILLNAAESPGTIPDVVAARIAAEACQAAVLDGFQFCMERSGDRCLKRMGIRDNLVRLSVGIEAAEDILADLDQALG